MLTVGVASYRFACGVHSTREEVAKHKSNEDIWQIINGRVFNVSKYLEDHPGGEEVLLDKGGMDATEDFEDVGHSNDARKTLNKFEIGWIPPSERKAAESSGGSGGGGAGMALGVVAALVAVGAAYFFFVFEPAAE